MTTRINVTVGDGGLLDRNAQQQAANRQGYVVRNEQNKAATQGQDELQQRRTAEGRDPATGLPLSSTGSRLRRVDQEPAASRGEGEEYFLLRPTSGPVDGVIPLRSRKLPSSLSVTGGVPTFSETAGPSGSQAMQADPTATPIFGYNYVSLTNSLPSSPASKYATKPLGDYTVQIYVRLGETYIADQREVDYTLRIRSSCILDEAVGSFYVDMLAGLQTSGSNPVSYFEFREASNFTGSLAIYDSGNIPLTSSAPKVSPGAWHHMAITRKGTTLRAFLNGQLLGTATSVVPETYLLPSGQFVELTFGQTQEDIYPGQTVSVHGLRFDTKCLYVSNFTPPESL